MKEGTCANAERTTTLLSAARLRARNEFHQTISVPSQTLMQVRDTRRGVAREARAQQQSSQLSQKPTCTAAEKDGGDGGHGKDGTTTDDDDTRRRRHSSFWLAQIVVAVTIPGRHELEWLDVAIRRSTSSKLVHAAASVARCAADKGEREKTMRYGNKKETGPDTVKPVRYELAGRHRTQTGGVLQHLATNLAEAKKGGLNAATHHKRLSAAIEERWFEQRRLLGTCCRLDTR